MLKRGSLWRAMGFLNPQHPCAFALVFLCPWVNAQAPDQVGQVTGLEEVARSGYGTPPELKRLGPLYAPDTLSTDSTGRLNARLKSGHSFTLSNDVEVRIQKAGDDSLFFLEVGTMRVITSGKRGSSVIVRTTTGEIRAEDTGFIVTCPTRGESCIFVGLYAVSVVTALADPANPLRLERQFFTELRPNESPSPPRQLPERRFRRLVEETTIRGTGDPKDQASKTDQAASGKPDDSAAGPALITPGAKLSIGRIPDQPLNEFKSLPPPPPPPSPPPPRPPETP